jgi:outer membrane protein OmpA-like peptidoglycan-associated protein
VRALRRLAARGLVLAVSGIPLVGAAADNDAEVRRMIESLRPAAPQAAPAAPSTSGRTRNLVIEPAAAPATGATASPVTASPSTAAPTTSATGQPATAAAPTPAAREGASLSLAIAFQPNSAQLLPDSGATLGALVAAMLSTELRGHRFVIEGHTDASGSPAQNMRLSRERAEQVRLFLVTLGVDAERLRAVGKGASDPVNPRDPRSPENRRVRVVALP